MSTDDNINSTTKTRTKRVGQIYHTKKHKLVFDLRKFGVPTRGTVEEQRHRLREYVLEDPLAFGVTQTAPNHIVPKPMTTSTKYFASHSKAISKKKKMKTLTTASHISSQNFKPPAIKDTISLPPPRLTSIHQAQFVTPKSQTI